MTYEWAGSKGEGQTQNLKLSILNFLNYFFFLVGEQEEQRRLGEQETRKTIRRHK